jgi:CheY-like chemotaxis protein
MSTGQLDYGVVERLRSVGGDALVRRLLRLFLVTSGEALGRIDTALQSGALPVVATAAHHLFSSAAQLKLNQISEIAERLEIGARAGHVDGLHEEVEHLAAALGSAAVVLRAELEKLPKPARVAVVDDSEDVRVLLRLVLERQYDVAEYATGSSALLGLRRFPVDLLILDLTLPDMSGIDLLNFIRADSRLSHIPAVALTALTPDDEHAYVAAGFDLHVRKPILDTDELLASINHLLKTDHSEWQ